MKKPLFLILMLCGMMTQLYAQPSAEKITLEDIWKDYKFYPKSVHGIRWMKDGQFYSSLTENNIVKYDVTNGEAVSTILSGNTLQPVIKIEDYSFSADEQKILLMTQKQSIYRRSFKADYYVYDLANKSLKKLSENGKQSYATFSPDGTKVAFARNNNLFVVDLASMSETQVTTDGQFNHIINGSADWVYEEEFSMAKAFFWSPDSKKIAFYTFNEAHVKEYNMQMWNGADPYPLDYRFKYPKAGEDNSEIKISIYDVAGAKVQPVNIGQNRDIYIPRVQWTQDSNLLSVIRLNRLQNKLEILHANATTGESNVVLTEESQTYVDIDYCDDLTYLENGKEFIYTSEKDGFKHIYLYKMDGSLVRQITKGNWEVTELVGIDESSKKPVLYYISTEVSPLDKDFYSVRVDGKNKTKLSHEKGTTGVNMSNDFKYYIENFSSSAHVPTVALYQTNGNKLIKKLQENGEYAEKVNNYGFVEKEHFTFKTNQDVELFGYMLKPADFDENKQYPVLMFQYSGPGSNQVANSWGGGNYAWHQMLTQEGYIVVVVDGRGTGNRGRKFKHQTYAQLGKLESIDQIETAKYLKTLNYVDGGRIGIWGWSFGGYMSSLCMFTGGDAFKMAIAVAPVTTWRFYDSIYTERYLKRPQDNPAGYDDNSPISHVEGLNGKFLLIHGTGDDNVHVQNAIELQDALIKAGKQFDVFYYPNRNHGIYGGNTRLHLFTMMTDYIKANL
ncbi:S9 family peptidase [Limibacter armeniacum]|uniref:S9 family peptidase n=1 Tax=Limibacter armeniacum TaxID=466084 RepID=UPI002FE50AD1